VVVYLVVFLYRRWMSATMSVAALLPGEIPPWGHQLFSALFLILGLAVIIIIGVVSTTLVGRAAARVWYWVIFRIPILSRIYAAVSQVGAAFSFRDRVFRAVVLIEYPRSGVYRVGLVTTDDVADIKHGENMVAVFVPSTPNIMTGYLFLTTDDQLTTVDITVEDAIKMVVSGGFVTPGDGTQIDHDKDASSMLWRQGRARQDGSVASDE